MKIRTFVLLFAGILDSGCAGRMDCDLLQARIREQGMQLAETEREMAKARAELKRTRQEADLLRAQLEQHDCEQVESAMLQPSIHKVHVHSFASGGLNKDGEPGDDAVVVQFVPIDIDSEPLKVPGRVKLQLLDPELPETEGVLGQWSFTEDECRRQWTRGIATSGYQFTLPLESVPQHKELLIQLEYFTNDHRFEASQIVKVETATERSAHVVQRAGRKPIQSVPETDENLPPVRTSGDIDEAQDSIGPSESDSTPRRRAPPGTVTLDSTNWTDASIPQLR